MTRSASSRSNLLELPVRGRFATERFERALAALREVVAQDGQRMTSPRQVILSAVLQRTGRFDAGALVDDLRRGGLRISSAAVYRNMPLLVAARIIRETESSATHAQLYEVVFEQRPSDQLVCLACGAVEEFDAQSFDVLRAFAAETHRFALTSHVHELTGVCAACRRSAKPRK